MMAKDYLRCRMDHNLMAPDEMRNLGFADESITDPTPISQDGLAAQDSKKAP